MKTALVLFVSFAAMAAAQDADRLAPDSPQIELRRVKSVTWDLQDHKLVWTVQKGVPQNGEFVPSSEEQYEISPSDGMMAVQGEQRGFTSQEAAWLQHLLDVLTLYCAESVVWWQGGQGVPQDPNAPATKPSSPDPETKPTPIHDGRTRRATHAQPKKSPGTPRVELAARR